eukprot:PhF_6_TR15920/c2_g1_i2/m.24632
MEKKQQFGAGMMFIIVITMMMSSCCWAMPQYGSMIPNSGNVVRNGVKYSSPGVGHINPAGGSTQTSFGESFALTQGWTLSLCLSDSDGDGYSNGQELGDPDCTWRMGGTPSRTTNISHPGYADSMPIGIGLQPMYNASTESVNILLFKGGVETTFYSIIARTIGARLFPMNASTYVAGRTNQTAIKIPYFIGYSPLYVATATPAESTAVHVPVGVLPLCVASLDPALNLTVRELAAVYTQDMTVINASPRKAILTTLIPLWGPNTTQGRSFLASLGLAGIPGFPANGSYIPSAVYSSRKASWPAISVEDKDLGSNLRNKATFTATSRRIGVMLPVHAIGYDLYCAQILEEDGTPFPALTPSDAAFMNVDPTTGSVKVLSRDVNPLLTTINLFVTTTLTTPRPEDLEEAKHLVRTLHSSGHFGNALGSLGGIPLATQDTPQAWQPLEDMILAQSGTAASVIRTASTDVPSTLSAFVDPLLSFSNMKGSIDMTGSQTSTSSHEGGVRWTFTTATTPVANNSVRYPLLRGVTVGLVVNIPGMSDFHLPACTANLMLRSTSVLTWGSFEIRVKNPRMPPAAVSANVTRIDSVDEPMWLGFAWDVLRSRAAECVGTDPNAPMASPTIKQRSLDDVAIAVSQTPYSYAVLPLFMAKRYGLTIVTILDDLGIAMEPPSVLPSNRMALTSMDTDYSIKSTWAPNRTVTYTPGPLDYPFIVPLYVDIPLFVTAEDNCVAWQS